MSVVPSPDGRTYAFVAAGGGADDATGGGPALYTIADDGSRLTRLTHGGFSGRRRCNTVPARRRRGAAVVAGRPHHLLHAGKRDLLGRRPRRPVRMPGSGIQRHRPQRRDRRATAAMADAGSPRRAGSTSPCAWRSIAPPSGGRSSTRPGASCATASTTRRCTAWTGTRPGRPTSRSWTTSATPTNCTRSSWK